MLGNKSKMEQFEYLVSHPKWLENIGSARVYVGMSDLIMEILGCGDRRTIAFWIGKKKQFRVRNKQDRLVGSEKNQTLHWVPTYHYEYEWEDAFLQRHGYIETREDPDQKQSLELGFDLRTFKILKGVKDGKTVSEPIPTQNAPHP
jgi:hypothetical protein